MRSFIMRLIGLSLALVLLFSAPGVVSADNYGYGPILSKCERFLYLPDEEGGCSLFFYTGDDREIVIPPTIDGYTVTVIISAFGWRDYTTMYLPSSVDKIVSDVFTSSEFQTLYLTGDAPEFHKDAFGYERPLTVM